MKGVRAMLAVLLAVAAFAGCTGDGSSASGAAVQQSGTVASSYSYEYTDIEILECTPYAATMARTMVQVPMGVALAVEHVADATINGIETAVFSVRSSDLDGVIHGFAAVGIRHNIFFYRAGSSLEDGPFIVMTTKNDGITFTATTEQAEPAHIQRIQEFEGEDPPADYGAGVSIPAAGPGGGASSSSLADGGEEDSSVSE